jgi:serine/threonine-protein kinase
VTLSTDLPSGSKLLGYRIERLLGRGGAGVVYLAHQLVLDRMVALKLLVPELAENSEFRDRFLRESRLASSLDHPSIVPVFDAGEVDGRLYISMRYIEGGDLGQLLEPKVPLETARTLSLLAPIADALDAAHAKGLVHGDVKPSNILVDDAGRAYLADFGLSRRLSEGERAGASSFTGSVDYAAPEQIERIAVGSAADVYALGCVLYQCLTGSPPFGPGSALAILFGHLNDPPPEARERNATLPPAIEAVLQKALAKDAGVRHTSCTELVADAEAALRPPATRPRRRRLVASLAGLSVILAAALAASLLAWRGGSGAIAASDTLMRIDPDTNRIAERRDVGHGATGVAAGAGAIWVSSRDDGSVWRVDAQTGAVKRIPGFSEPGDIAVGGDDNVYVGFRDGVGTIDTVSLNGSTIGLGSSGQKPAVATGALGVWAVDEIGFTVDRLRLTPTLGAIGVVERVPLDRTDNEADGFDTLTAVAVGTDAVWVTGDAYDPVLFRVEPNGLEVTRFRLPSAPGSVAAGAGAVWVAGQIEDVVWRVDPRSGTVTDAIQVGTGVSGLAVEDGSVWTVSSIAGTVSRIDPGRRTVEATIEVGGLPVGIAAGEGGIWVASRAT